MNQTIVTDVIEILYHSISRMTCGDTGVKMWAVCGHGEDGFTQLIDSYDSLAVAQADYPDAWNSATDWEFVSDEN